MAVHKIHGQQRVTLSCCCLLTWKVLHSTKASTVTYSPGRSSQCISAGAVGGWLLFLESTRGPCYEKRHLSRNTGPVTSARKLGWWHKCPKYLGQTDRSWEEQAHPETSVLGEDSTVRFCWSSTVRCFWWPSANVPMVCVVVPRTQKHSTHALRDGENRMDQLSLCCLVRGKHLPGGSALGTNVKMPFSLRVMANIVWKSVEGV